MKKFRNRTTYRIAAEYYIAYGCNLNCKACATYSSLIPSATLIPLEQIKKDFEKFYKITLNGKKVRRLTIMGGEPLLHPEIKEIILYLSDLFNESELCLFTNGILLNKMSDDFFNIVKEHITKLLISEYPINFNYENIYKVLDKYNINYVIVYRNNRQNNKWSHQILKNTHDENIDKPCFYKRLFILKDNKIFNCTEIAFFEYFDKYFKGQHNIVLTEDDYIDLNNINTFEELMRAKEKSPHFCGFCRGSDRRTTDWEVSSKDINEWLSKE